MDDLDALHKYNGDLHKACDFVPAEAEWTKVTPVRKTCNLVSQVGQKKGKIKEKNVSQVWTARSCCGVA